MAKLHSEILWITFSLHNIMKEKPVLSKNHMHTLWFCQRPLPHCLHNHSCLLFMKIPIEKETVLFPNLIPPEKSNKRETERGVWRCEIIIRPVELFSTVSCLFHFYTMAFNILKINEVGADSFSRFPFNSLRVSPFNCYLIMHWLFSHHYHKPFLEYC